MGDTDKGWELMATRIVKSALSLKGVIIPNSRDGSGDRV